jgi:hypothetical protein
MRVLLDFAGSTEFENFVNGIGAIMKNVEPDNRGYVQGVLLDVHPHWRDLWRIRGAGDHLLDRDRGPLSRGIRDHLDDLLAEDGRYDDYDPTWRPRAWTSYVAAFGEAQHEGKSGDPFLAKIRVLPTTVSTLPIRRSLMDLANKQRFFAIVEDRPEATLAANVQGGSDVSSTYSGTLGGFLADGGTRYGLTCGHVATTPGHAIDTDDAGGLRLAGAGTVFDSNYSILRGQSTPQFCNPFAATLPEVDAALIELDPLHLALNSVNRIGSIVGITHRTSLSPGQIIRMQGTASGVHDYDVGALAVCYRFYYNDRKYYCFANLFEVKSRPPAVAAVFNQVLGRVVAAKPLQGDSGAWLCAFERRRNGVDEYSFCGTLTGVDRDVGYASFADSFIRWSQKNLTYF